MSTGIPYCDEVLEVTGGCTKCSPGCQICWAIKEVWRMAHNPKLGDKWQGLVAKKNGVLNWTGKIKCFDDALNKLRKKPTRYFIDSKADLFHEKVPFEFIDDIFTTVFKAPQHTYLILTKRVKQMAEYFSAIQDGWIDFGENRDSPPPFVHLGVSISTPDEMWKITELSRIPAAVRWISFEPLLADVGDIPLTSCREDDNDLEEFGQHIDGVVVGGESGPGARPMHPDWVRSIRDKCVAADVAFFMKQWGKWGIAEPIPNDQQKRFCIIGGSEPLSPNTIFKIFPEHANSTIPLTGWVKVGKKKAGCILDGKEWKQLPERRA